MDIASLIGFLGAVGMIIGAMISGGGVAPFIDVPSLLIVFGGTSLQSCTPVHYLFFWVALPLWAKPFSTSQKMDELVERMAELAAIARKDGMMALKAKKCQTNFSKKGCKCWLMVPTRINWSLN